MYEHHKRAIERAVEKLRADERVLAVILGGSIAHGFAAAESDVDLMLVLSEVDYRSAIENEALYYSDNESADYENGCVEGKYISRSFIQAVAEKGSEPARFAFQNAITLYSGIDGLDGLIAAASAYPLHNKAENLQKFYAQFEAWNWMYYQGLKKADLYVINHSVTNLSLFAGRLLLAHNELLYPYHKWFLRVLSGAQNKPHDVVKLINSALQTKSESDVKMLYDTVKNFCAWPEYRHGWVDKFVMDSELNWMNGPVPVADL